MGRGGPPKHREPPWVFYAASPVTSPWWDRPSPFVVCRASLKHCNCQGQNRPSASQSERNSDSFFGRLRRPAFEAVLMGRGSPPKHRETPWAFDAAMPPSSGASPAESRLPPRLAAPHHV